MKYISGLKPKFENQVQIWKWKTRKWETEFQAYFKKSYDLGRWYLPGNALERVQQVHEPADLWMCLDLIHAYPA